MPAEWVEAPTAPRPAPVFVCPTCAASLAANDPWGYCGTCGSAWLRCRDCQLPVSSLWRVCPRDGRAVRRRPEDGGRGYRAFGLASPAIVAAPSRHFVNAPFSYGGYVWALTTSGDVRRVSPSRDRADLVENLGIEFGNGPFGLLPASDRRRALLAAVGERQIALLDPVTHRPGDGPRLSPLLPLGDVFVSMVGDSSPAVAAQDHLVAALARHGKTVQLAIWNLETGALDRIPLPEPQVVGPFLVGGRLAAYGDRTLFLLNGGALEAHALPPGFQPSQADDSSLRKPWGRAGVMAYSTWAYLPGSINGSPALLLLRFDSETPRFSVVSLHWGDTYRAGPAESLILTGDHRYKVVTRTSVTAGMADKDPHLLPYAAAAADGVEFGWFRNFGKQVELRLFPGGIERVTAPEDAHILDTFVFDGYVTVTWIAKQDLEIVSWPLA
jgi:hypothetical protein